MIEGQEGINKHGNMRNACRNIIMNLEETILETI
jgi:hypothetical protein